MDVPDLPFALAWLAVLAAWGAWAAAFYGWGTLFLRAADARATPTFAFAPLVGFAVVLALLQLAHLAVPAGAPLAWLVLAVGVLAAAPRLRRLRPARSTLAVVAPLAAWLANRALGPADAHDTSLYHLAAVDWLRGFPLVVGLGNLNSHQAATNASLLWGALADAAGPLRGAGTATANGLVLLLLLAPAALATARLVRRAPRHGDAFLAATVPVLVLLALGSEVRTYDTDLPAGVLLLAAAWCVAADDRRAAGAAGIALAAGAAACKLSVLVPALVLAIALVLRLTLDAALTWSLADRRTLRRDAVVGSALALLLAAGWATRAALMTGYPLYPLRTFALDADWRMPDYLVREHAYGIGVAPRHRVPTLLAGVAERVGLDPLARALRPPVGDERDLTATNWLRPWAVAQVVAAPVEVVAPLTLGAVAWTAVLARRRRPTRGAVTLLVAGLLGVAHWLAVAPDARFGWPACWLVGASGVVAVTRDGQLHRGWLAALAGVAVLGLAHRVAQVQLLHKRSAWRELPLILPTRDWRLATTKPVEFAPVTSHFDVTVMMPAQGGALVGRGPTPRSGWPQLDPDLALRDPARGVAGGFVIRRDPRTLPPHRLSATGPVPLPAFLIDSPGSR